MLRKGGSSGVLAGSMVVCFPKWICSFAIMAGEAVWILSIWPLNFCFGLEQLWVAGMQGGKK
jgi:hypothetical protein